MNYRKTVATVIEDRIRRDESEDEPAFLAEVAAQTVEMQKHLFDANSTVIDRYGGEAKAYAYAFKYLPVRADLLDCLLGCIDGLDHRMASESTFAITVLGGGPGSEALALVGHLGMCELNFSDLTLKLTTVDALESWTEVRKQLWKATQPFRGKTLPSTKFERSFVNHDLGTPFDVKTARELRADLYVLSYIVSEMGFDCGALKQNIAMLASVARKGAQFLFVERLGYKKTGENVWEGQIRWLVEGSRVSFDGEAHLECHNISKGNDEKKFGMRTEQLECAPFAILESKILALGGHCSEANTKAFAMLGEVL